MTKLCTKFYKAFMTYILIDIMMLEFDISAPEDLARSSFSTVERAIMIGSNISDKIYWVKGPINLLILISMVGINKVQMITY